MISLDVGKIPDKHIMKRWTVDARDILPDHIKHYQKDMGPPEASTFRHSAMYITALEVVQLGDTNPDAFECVMNGLCELKAKAIAFGSVKDGKSIVEKTKATSGGNSNCSRQSKNVTSKKKENSSMDGQQSYGEVSMNCIDGGKVDDMTDEVTSINNEANLLLLSPERRLKRGRPTTARDKPPYEHNNKRSRFCSVCREKGHKSSTCPLRGDRPVKPRKDPQCSKCGLIGHRKTSCSKPLYSTLTGITVGGATTEE
jgi:hypothetical protein